MYLFSLYRFHVQVLKSIDKKQIDLDADWVL